MTKISGNGHTSNYNQSSFQLRNSNRTGGLPTAASLIQERRSRERSAESASLGGALTGYLLNTADGALQGVTDGLQRIRELAVQSRNATYSDSDRKNMQKEIDGLKAFIQDTAKGTEFNTQKLLDGSLTDFHTALNADGSGMDITISGSTLEQLGIADFDITKNFKLSDIDRAISQITGNRSTIGAASTRLSFSSALPGNGIYDHSALLDAVKLVSEQKKQHILEQYQLFSQKKKQETDKRQNGLLNG